MRLFFGRFCVAPGEALTDHKRGIAICVSTHMARGAEAKRRARGVAANVLPLGVTHYACMTAMAFSRRVARVDPAGENPSVPRLVFGVGEDPPLHPEGSLRVSPAAILALFRLEVSQVFKHQDGSLLLCGEQDNAGANQMGNVLIGVADLAPKVGIVLFVLCNDASL